MEKGEAVVDHLETMRPPLGDSSTPDETYNSLLVYLNDLRSIYTPEEILAGIGLYLQKHFQTERVQ